MLFQQDLSGSDRDETLELFWKERKASAKDRKFAVRIFNQALDHREEINEKIQKSVRKWRLDRISSVDRNLLKMALAEFLYCETPKAIVIDEAIEIAKEFSGEKSAEFINGVLDAVS
jgi:N utilization substance protein B